MHGSGRVLSIGQAVLALCCAQGRLRLMTGLRATALWAWVLLGVAVQGCRRETPPLVWRPSNESECCAAQSPPSSPGRALRVATWNLQWLSAQAHSGPVPRSEEDYRRLARYAQRLEPDVVALQEVDGPQAVYKVFGADRYRAFVSDKTGVQRTGFAVRRELRVSRHPDLKGLDVGRLRHGTDITVHSPHGDLRLLSVHLKSGCFDRSLTSERHACRQLGRQLPVLERWVDQRAAEGLAFGVLGDFNRRFFAKPDDGFWQDLADGEPALASLWSPTENGRSTCWGSRYPQFIDHLVWGRLAAARAMPNSFRQWDFDPEDEPHAKRLSDHCPLSIEVR